MALHKIPIISGGERMLQKSMWFLACLACLFASAAAQSGTGATSREIDSCLSRVVGAHSRVALMVGGAGRANEGLRADWQQQLAEVQKGVGFRYIRMHGLLHDDMGVYSEAPRAIRCITSSTS